MDSLFDTQTFITYCVAATALVISPGPGQALVITRSVERGPLGGILTSVGLEIGTLVHTLAAALGLSAILATSATAFLLITYAGAAYLLVLGVFALRSSFRPATESVVAPESGGNWALVLHATVTGVLNPKVAVFFLAFLPQFVHPERGSVLAQFLVLGVVLSVIALAWDSVVATLIGRARGRFVSSPRFAAWRERVTGAVLLGLGLRLALSER